MHIRWEDGFEIGASVDNNEITISANREGMISLANIMLDLAVHEPGTHVHLDQYNSLQAGPVELIIERVG